MCKTQFFSCHQVGKPITLSPQLFLFFFFSLLYKQWETNPHPEGGILYDGTSCASVFGSRILEGFPTWECLWFLVLGGDWEALCDRKGSFPAGEGWHWRWETLKALPTPISKRKGTSGAVHELGWEHRWKDWAGTHFSSTPNDAPEVVLNRGFMCYL